jgi:hypothetical protein
MPPAAGRRCTLVAIDKLDKIGVEGVRRELGERGIAEAAVTALLGGNAGGARRKREPR